MSKLDPLLVAMAEDAENGIYTAVTVCCAGAVISGTVVSHELFNQRLSQGFLKLEDEKAQELGHDLAKSLPKNDNTDFIPYLLFLANAQVMLGSSSCPSEPTSCWRCKIDAISAWSFGTIAS